MTRFDGLLEVVARHQALAAENYDRIRAIAEHLRAGFCGYLDSTGDECVRLAPPFGPVELKAYGDEAFTLPPRGFRPIAPITFGISVRVTDRPDWIRIAMTCSKQGENFLVEIAEGKSQSFSLPFDDDESQAFFDMLYAHLVEGFGEQVRQYVDGDYGGHEIGFDMWPDPAPPAKA